MSAAIPERLTDEISMYAPLLIAALLASPTSQQLTPDPHQASAQEVKTQSDRIQQAEDLLERGDYKAAEPRLAQLVTANPKDAHLLFDLGLTQEHNNEEAAAAVSYAAAIAADAKLAEPHVALGLLEARNGRSAEARTQLDAATKLPATAPALKARALRALARLDQATAPDRARDELAQALQLTGEQPGDAELTASLSGSGPGNGSPSGPEAEDAYRRALAQNPGDISATVELGSLLQKAGKLAEADALLTPALAAHPNDPRLAAQTATLYAAEGRSPEALALLKKLRATDPQTAQNPYLTRLLAHLSLVSGDAAAAEPLYRDLLAGSTQDPELLDDLGSVLVREQKFAEAEAVLAKAVQQRDAFHDDAAWGEAAGHLAFAASRNHHPAVALQALSQRATVLPNSPASLFLEATSHDTLHQKKQAQVSYRAFLAVANGKLPDEEFEARHRLVALEHEH